MARISYPAQAKTALKGADVCLVIGSAARLKGGLSEAFPPALSELTRTLVTELESTGGGATASSLAPEEIRRLKVGVLSGPGSRYNTPARPDLVHRIVQGSGITKHERAAIIVALEDPALLDATLTGVARALPLLSRRSSDAREMKLQLLALGPDDLPLRIEPLQRSRVSFVRESAALVDTPPSELTPAAFAAEAKKTLEALPKVTVKEIVGPALSRQKLGGIFGVGKGATSAPRLLVATYRPARPKGPHIALVGKGVTFDTGGLHLKPRGGMEGMKCDMGGAAAMFGAFRVIAESGIKTQVSLLLGLVENAIGPESYKPDDILTMHSGKTVEINNTDAEGRLVLADGLSYAARTLGAEILIDAATLTGAQMVATGANHAAVVSNDEALEALMMAAGKSSGDLCHPLPFAPELYQQEFKSPIADMRNSVKNRANAQSSCAAQFLYSHIDGTGARWAHVDLAGPAWQGDRGTGFGVSLVSAAVAELAG